MKAPNKVLVALDPGAAAAGIAVFEDGRLRHVDEFAGKDGWLARAEQVATLVENHLSIFRHAFDYGRLKVEFVFERPQVYASSKSRGDRNDLVSVALMAGASARGAEDYCTRWGLNFSVREYKPNQWKRGVPKPKKKGQPYVIEERVRERLADDERSLIVGLGWDAHDAVGIGLVHLGRARPGVI